MPSYETDHDWGTERCDMEVISGWSPDDTLKVSEIHVWGSIPLASAESYQAGMRFDPSSVQHRRT